MLRGPFEFAPLPHQNTAFAIVIAIIGAVLLPCGCDRQDAPGIVAKPARVATRAPTPSKETTSTAAIEVQAPKLFPVLRITDNQGAQVDLHSANLDYTDLSSGVGFVDVESIGVRILQEDSFVRVLWNNIARLEIDPADKKTPWSLRGRLQLKSGPTNEVAFKWASKISGHTERGDYFIHFSKIKTVVPIEIAFNKSGPLDPTGDSIEWSESLAKCNQSFTQLIVVERSGTVTELRKPSIDYSSQRGSSALRPTEKEGLLIKFDRGQGFVSVPWGLIREVRRKFRKTLALQPDDISGDRSRTTPADQSDWTLDLRNPPTIGVNLESDSENGLAGQTDRGRFSVRLKNVEALLPVHDMAQQLTQRESARRISELVMRRLVPAESHTEPDPTEDVQPSASTERKSPPRPATVLELTKPRPQSGSPKTRRTSESSKPAKSDPEKVASGKLTLAKQLLETNKAAAKKRLEELVKDFGGTAAGKEAAELLKGI